MVELEELDAEGQLDLEDLLGHYTSELRATDQSDEADRIQSLLTDAKTNFLMIIPEKVQADPSISTE
jgi:glutamate synthase (NADPH/NADH) large chain